MHIFGKLRCKCVIHVLNFIYVLRFHKRGRRGLIHLCLLAIRRNDCTCGASICGLLNVTELHSKHIAAFPLKCVYSQRCISIKTIQIMRQEDAESLSHFISGWRRWLPVFPLPEHIQIMFLHHSHRYRCLMADYKIQPCKWGSLAEFT